MHGKQRGEDADTVFVFALVIDNDADKDRATGLELEPTLTVETSPGNSHQHFFFDAPLSWKVAKELGRGLRAAAGACGCSGKIGQPYRVPGTPNYPDEEKRNRGRVICETSIIQCSGKRWSLDEMQALFPPVTVPERDPASNDAACGELEVYLIKCALRAIPNNPPLPHQIQEDGSPSWLGVLFACKWASDHAATPEIAEQIRQHFFAWSDSAKGCKDAKPDQDNKQRNRIWRSANSNRERPIQIGSLFLYAKMNGWNKVEAENRWVGVVAEWFDDVAAEWAGRLDEFEVRLDEWRSFMEGRS